MIISYFFLAGVLYEGAAPIEKSQPAPGVTGFPLPTQKLPACGASGPE